MQRSRRARSRHCHIVLIAEKKAGSDHASLSGTLDPALSNAYVAVWFTAIVISGRHEKALDVIVT